MLLPDAPAATILIVTFVDAGDVSRRRVCNHGETLDC